mmetsp:Transcript_3723/g.3152  ORF Transcript_3723/g.3152 Transcript_3723/m.3152 type:complete len:127 (+) Transcript_3723:64-444(+)
MSQYDHTATFTKRMDDLKDQSLKYIITQTEKLNQVLSIINKLEHIKMGITIDRVRERVKNQDISITLGTMNSLFITDSAKIVYDKYINCLKEYYNTLLKHLMGITDDFKKLEQRYIFIQNNEGTSG